MIDLKCIRDYISEYDALLTMIDPNLKENQMLAEKIIAQHIEIQQLICGDIDKEINGLMQKKDWIDPVSGEPRYGPVNRERITKVFNEYLGLMEDLQIVNNEMPPIHKNVDEYRKVNENVNAIITHQTSQNKIWEQNEKSTTPNVLIDEKTDYENHIKAELIRQRKHAELLEQSEFYEKIGVKLHQFVNMYLHSHYAGPFHNTISQEKLIDVCLKLKSSVQNEKTYQNTIQSIIDVLDRIISRPDDNQRRTLRVTHPLLKEKITNKPWSLEILILIGFKAKIISLPTNEPILNVDRSSQSVKQFLDMEMENFDPSDASSFQMNTTLFDVLNPQSNWDMILEMDEPSIDILLTHANVTKTTIKLTWIEWFDSLNHSKQILVKCLTN